MTQNLVVFVTLTPFVTLCINTVFFWLRQEPKESLSVSVRPSVRYKVLSLHLSGSNLQAISQQSVSSQLEVTEQSENNQRAIKEQSESK